jgi:hypothetical protein
MNLIYLRNHTPKTKKFIKKKLRGGEHSSIYDIEAADCCLPPADPAGEDYLFTFLNDISPEMLDFIYRSGQRTELDQN